MACLRSVVAIAVLVGASLGRADPGDLKVNFRKDLAITAAAAGLAFGLGAAPLGAGHCRICAPSEFDSDARNVFKLRSPAGLQDARRASDYLASYALPAGAIAASGLVSLRDGSRREFFEDMLVIGQAVAIAADLNAFSKGFVGRPRPGEADPGGSGRSFYSSHTSRAFTFAVAAGTVSSIRGRESAPWVWAAGLTLAAGVGYLRIASDAHWLTDVGAGAAVGSAVGFAVPWFFHRRHRRAGSRLELMPAPGGVAFSF